MGIRNSLSESGIASRCCGSTSFLLQGEISYLDERLVEGKFSYPVLISITSSLSLRRMKNSRYVQYAILKPSNLGKGFLTRPTFIVDKKHEFRSRS